MRCELASKRDDSGFRRDTLRFDPREVRLCLREPGYAWVRRNGRAGHSRPDRRQALSNDGNVLHGASTKNLPKLARRNDLERASCREAQQRSIASDEDVGVAGERLTEHNCVRRIDIHASGLGVVDDLRCLAGDEIDNLGRPNDGKLDLCTQRLLKFAKHVSPKNQVVVQQHQFEDLRTQSSCGERAHQDIRIEKDPHERMRNTSSSVTSPCASANGKVFLRSSRKRATAT